MRIFVSWSGGESRAVAHVLRDWLPHVLQDLQVYVSSQDIASGERWLNNVNVNLQEHQFGISVVTATNVVAPWILYEAGAIAKSLGDSRLIPMLCGLNGISIANHPLSQFQWVKAQTQEDMYRLVASINQHKEGPLPEERLKQAFLKWYPDFVSEYEAIEFQVPSEPPAPVVPPSSERVLPVLETIMRELRDLRAEVADVRTAASHKTLHYPTLMSSRFAAVRKVQGGATLAGAFKAASDHAQGTIFGDFQDAPDAIEAWTGERPREEPHG